MVIIKYKKKNNSLACIELYFLNLDIISKNLEYLKTYKNEKNNFTICCFISSLFM